MEHRNPNDPNAALGADDAGETRPAPARRMSRRGTWLGSLIALLVVLGVGWLAWSLTHQEPAAAAGAGRAAGAPGAGGGSGGGGSGGGGGGPGGGGGARGGPATTVGVAAAEQLDIPVTLEALGTVVPQATVRVRPQVSGVLQQVLYKEGQLVRKGELLATIDPRQFEMSLQQASGQRMRDEAQLEAARVTLQRFRTLLAQDSIARQEVDTQAALVRQLEASVVIAKANEGTARLNLGYTRITAPIAGRVGLRTVDVGNVVNPSDANGVAVLTQMQPIQVEFSVPQDQAPGLQQDTGAPMEAKAFDRTRTQLLDTGVFSSLDNQVDTQTGTVRARARFDNAKLQLFPSQFVNLQLRLRTLKNAVAVPVAAVRTGANGDYVFVLREDRTVQQRTVRRGQATAERIQIVEGLQAGERVITEGADRLRDGGRVVLPGDAPRQGGPGGRQGPGGARSGGAPQDGAPGAGPRPGPAAPASAPAASPASTSPAPASAPAAEASAGRASAPAAAAATTRPAAAATPGPSTAPAAAGPTPEQRQRMLDAAASDPAQLERRKRLLEAIDRGDPQALERWQQMQQRRREGGTPQ